MKRTLTITIATVMLGTMCLASALPRGWSEEHESPRSRGIDQPVGSPQSALPRDGIWESKYDSRLDGRLEPREAPRIEISVSGSWLVGRYEEGRAVGKDNDSIFQGRVIPGAVPMVMLRQEYQDHYTAVYTGKLVGPQRFVGSYHDNQGMSGDWSLELVSASGGSTPDGPGLESTESRGD